VAFWRSARFASISDHSHFPGRNLRFLSDGIAFLRDSLPLSSSVFSAFVLTFCCFALAFLVFLLPAALWFCCSDLFWALAPCLSFSGSCFRNSSFSACNFVSEGDWRVLPSYGIRAWCFFQFDIGVRAALLKKSSPHSGPRFTWRPHCKRNGNTKLNNDFISHWFSCVFLETLIKNFLHMPQQFQILCQMQSFIRLECIFKSELPPTHSVCLSFLRLRKSDWPSGLFSSYLFAPDLVAIHLA